MPIQASVQNNQITANVGETQIDVSVSGGFGPSGLQGPAATVTVGTVTTGAPGSSASVVNAGSSSAAVLNFTIPAGQPGATGPQGAQGPAGTTSWNGITDRPSTFAPSAHQHAIIEVVGLSAALDGKQAAGSYAASVHTHSASQITDFAAAVVAAAPPTTNASLLTSGTLDAARLPGSVVLTTDSRLSDARQPLTHTHTASQITDFTSAVIAAAPPTVDASLLTQGTLPDARLSANIARTSDVSSAVAAVVNAAPAALDTLNELAAALGNDASFATTVTNSLASKAPLANPTFTGTVSGITKSMVGLGNVPNTDATARANHTGTQTASTISDFASAVAAASPEEVLEYQTSASFPATGNASLLYLDTDASRAYRWAGGEYVEVGASSSFVASHTHAATAITGLATVATTGAYADLTGTPSLGTVAAQNANSVAITGGSINGTAIGATTASTGAFTTVTTTGNVGIGTASPATRLHVSGHVGREVARFQGSTDASDNRNFVSLFSTNPGFWWEISNQDPAGGGTTNGLAFRERSNADPSSTRVFLAAGGNVGIGTTSPVARLDVRGGFLFHTTSDYVAGTTGTRIALEHGAATGNTAGIINCTHTGGGAWSNLVLQSGGGNVGIGTVSPAANLDVAASVPQVRVSSTGGATGQLLSDGSSFYVGPTGAHALRLQTSGVTRAIIDSTGNVGIGTASPTISSGVGLHIGGTTMRLDTARTPASSTATGNTGEICWDSSYLYVCVAANSWRRIALSTF